MKETSYMTSAAPSVKPEAALTLTVEDSSLREDDSTAPSTPFTKPIPPPDVGTTAYLQILGGFLIFLNTWGIALSYGTFQSYYETSSFIDASPSSIAWIGSTQTFLLLFNGGLCGRLFDAGYLRPLLVTGSFLIVFGLMMASLARTYYQVLLSQGLCVGLGMGCLLLPSVGLPGTWFEKRRGMAIGGVTSGGALGGVIVPIMCQQLLIKVGFPWTMRILGIFSVVTLTAGGALLKQRLPPRSRGGFFEWTALKEPPFALYLGGMFFAMLGFYVFFQFVQSWAEATHLHTPLSPIYFLSLLNAASLCGRALPALLSDRYGPVNVTVPCTMISAILVFGWLGVRSAASLLAVIILYAFFAGGMMGLFPAAIASLTDDMSRYGARMGLSFVSMAIGSLIGTPVTGAIIGKRDQNGHWDGARIWSACTLLIGAILMCASRWAISRRDRQWRLKV